jgi:hypothetical protein
MVEETEEGVLHARSEYMIAGVGGVVWYDDGMVHRQR